MLNCGKDYVIQLTIFLALLLQEKSFQRGVSYVVAMVAEFDEYTNDWLYLREGTILPKYSISLDHFDLNILMSFVMCFFLTARLFNLLSFEQLLGLPTERGNHPTLQSSQSEQMPLSKALNILLVPVKHQQCWFRIWLLQDQ